jgi:hypothetical protein
MAMQVHPLQTFPPPGSRVTALADLPAWGEVEPRVPLPQRGEGLGVGG